ncbi:hypothetical protein KFR76_08945 [Corynebacterium diphtheriae]|nr:hypothetical protein KFR76_08945 [Corynebacterium diphtheriae]
MKIRTMTLVMAGASILATSSAQATTHSPERHLLEWCHKTFGEEQHDLCNYYNWAKDVAHRVRSENDTQYSEDFEFLAREALNRLYHEQKTADNA